MASIGRAAADEAAKIATMEEQDLIVEHAQDASMVVEHPSGNAPEEKAVVEWKVPLQTMDPLSSIGVVMGTPPPP